MLSNGEDELTSRSYGNGRRKNIEKAKVQWAIKLSGNQKINQYDLSKKQLQSKQEGGDWEDFDDSKKPAQYRGSYAWIVPRVPCLSYSYRLIVPLKNGDTTEKCFVTKTETLPAESIESIRDAKFSPSTVKNVAVKADDSNVNLTWNKSLCAEKYEVFVYMDIQDIGNREEKTKIVPDENKDLVEAHFSGLQSCTKYAADIIPKVQGVDNDKKTFNQPFHTKPNISSADKLDLDDLTPTKNSVALSFYNFKQSVNCLNKFDIKVCHKWSENSKDGCSDTKTEKLNVNSLKYSQDGLKHCTKYMMVVTPKYDGITINPKTVSFTTEFDENESYDNKVEPGISDAKVKIQNVDCFKSYVIKYRLLNKTKEPKLGDNSGIDDGWKEQSGNLDIDEILVNNLSPNSRYQIKMEATNELGNNSFLNLGVTEFETLKSPDRPRNAFPLESQSSNITNNSSVGDSGNSTESVATTESSGSELLTKSGKQS